MLAKLSTDTSPRTLDCTAAVRTCRRPDSPRRSRGPQCAQRAAPVSIVPCAMTLMLLWRVESGGCKIAYCTAAARATGIDVGSSRRLRTGQRGDIDIPPFVIFRCRCRIPGCRFDPGRGLVGDGDTAHADRMYDAIARARVPLASVMLAKLVTVMSPLTSRFGRIPAAVAVATMPAGRLPF